MASAELDSAVVLVTGASGFLGSHVVRALLEEGYKVRGTVRVLDNDTKVKPLKELGAAYAENQLELVEADLTKPETWESAVKGCTYVVHVASPFPATAGASEDEVVKPAVEGTTAVLKAAADAKVKRVVLTSSVVAVTGGMAPGMDGSRSFSEEDWGEPEKASDVYAKSKVLAERAAWDLVKDLPEGDEPRMELATILPGFIMGPVLCGGASTSMEVPRRLLERSMPAVPKLFFPVADVRDVALAHVRALTTPECAGQRHIVYTSGHWLKEVAQIMAKEFKPQGYCVPTLHCPYFVVWVKSLFDKTIKMTLPSIGKSVKLNNSKMSEVLNLEPHPLQETVLEMCYTMIEKGFIKKAKKYRGPKKEGEEGDKEGDAEDAPAEEGKEANGELNKGGEEKEGEEQKEEKKGEEEEKVEAEEKVEEVKGDQSPPSAAEEATEEVVTAVAEEVKAVAEEVKAVTEEVKAEEEVKAAEEVTVEEVKATSPEEVKVEDKEEEKKDGEEEK